MRFKRFIQIKPLITALVAGIMIPGLVTAFVAIRRTIPGTASLVVVETTTSGNPGDEIVNPEVIFFTTYEGEAELTTEVGFGEEAIKPEIEKKVSKPAVLSVEELNKEYERLTGEEPGTFPAPPSMERFTDEEIEKIIEKEKTKEEIEKMIKGEEPPSTSL